MTEIQGKSILVRVSVRFELSGVDCTAFSLPLRGSAISRNSGLVFKYEKYCVVN